MYKINKEKCVGCGLCVAVCSEGAEMKEDDKAEIIDQEKIEKCVKENVCPYEAIEKSE